MYLLQHRLPTRLPILLREDSGQLRELPVERLQLHLPHGIHRLRMVQALRQLSYTFQQLSFLEKVKQIE